MPSLAPPDIRFAAVADADDLASIRAQCFDSYWPAAELAAMLAQPQYLCLLAPGAGYVLAQTLPPEAEIITIAVSPAYQRRGIAQNLMQHLVSFLKTQSITALHLEVNENLHAARRLYEKTGFAQTGCRADYYVRANGEKADAILMRLDIPL